MSDNSQPIEPTEDKTEYFYLQVKNELRQYEFRCHKDSPYSEVKDALEQMSAWFYESVQSKIEEKQDKTDEEQPVQE